MLRDKTKKSLHFADPVMVRYGTALHSSSTLAIPSITVFVNYITTLSCTTTFYGNSRFASNHPPYSWKLLIVTSSLRNPFSKQPLEAAGLWLGWLISVKRQDREISTFCRSRWYSLHSSSAWKIEIPVFPATLNCITVGKKGTSILLQITHLHFW